MENLADFLVAYNASIIDSLIILRVLISMTSHPSRNLSTKRQFYSKDANDNPRKIRMPVGT
jgi:hypothetical protein